MKIVLFGHHNAAVKCIELLHKNKDYSLELVVCQANYQNESVWYDSVEKTCLKLGIKSVVYDNNQEAVKSQIELINPDVIFSIGFRKIIIEPIFKIPRLGAYNIHDSLLPAYRGFTPSTWVIINGEKETGVTIHKIEAGVDTGDILLQRKVPISNNDTGFDLSNKLTETTIDLFSESLNLFLKSEIKLIKQDASLASWFGRRGKNEKDDLIDWNLSSVQIYNLIRAISPPIACAYTYFNNKKVFIPSSKIINVDHKQQVEPGTVCLKSNDFIVVKTSDGFLQLTEYFENIDHKNIESKKISLLLEAGDKFQSKI